MSQVFPVECDDTGNAIPQTSSARQDRPTDRELIEVALRNVIGDRAIFTGFKDHDPIAVMAGAVLRAIHSNMSEPQKITAGALTASHIGGLVGVVALEGARIVARLDGFKAAEDSFRRAHPEPGIEVFLRGVAPVHADGYADHKRGFRLNLDSPVTIYPKEADA